MTVEALFKEYNQLTESEKARFMVLLHTSMEDNIPNWARKATEAINEEEWLAIEQLRNHVRAGKAQSQPLQEVISNLRKK